MTDAQQVPQVEKKLYRNNTGGWLGVVVIDFSGKDVGVPVEPHGTVWLSDAEAILTARAPKDPKDNPFEEQEFVGVDSQGTRKMFTMRPLTLESNDSRHVPSNDRYVPIFDQEGDARTIAGVRADEPPAITPAAAARSAEITSGAPAPQAAPAATPPPEAPGAPAAEPGLPPQPAVPTSPSPVTTGVEPLPSVPEEDQSWVAEPEAPGEVLQGSLQGSDTPVPTADPAPPAATPPPLPAQAAPTAPGGNPAAPGPAPDPSFPTVGETVTYTDPATGQTHEVPVVAQEETAAAVDPAIGEETGAAKPPAGPQPEGEYGQAEEVGSPEAPQQG